MLVSGLIRPSGNEALILLAIARGALRPCFSEEILAEYEAVLARPKFSFPVEEIAALIGTLRTNGELFDPTGMRASSPDPDDTKFLQCALAARADFIITGNRRDFPDPPYDETRVVAAGEILDLIIEEL